MCENEADSDDDCFPGGVALAAGKQPFSGGPIRCGRFVAMRRSECLRVLIASKAPSRLNATGPCATSSLGVIRTPLARRESALSADRRLLHGE